MHVHSSQYHVYAHWEGGGGVGRILMRQSADRWRCSYAPASITICTCAHTVKTNAPPTFTPTPLMLQGAHVASQGAHTLRFKSHPHICRVRFTHCHPNLHTHPLMHAPGCTCCVPGCRSGYTHTGVQVTATQMCIGCASHTVIIPVSMGCHVTPFYRLLEVEPWVHVM
jgi:hypothetical protein